MAPGTLDYQKLGYLAPFVIPKNSKNKSQYTVSLRSTIFDMDMVLKEVEISRKTKIMVQLSSGWSSGEDIRVMLRYGLDVIKIDLVEDNVINGVFHTQINLIKKVSNN